MAHKKPVIVYAASGYTGRLVCIELTKARVPFVAAGRNLQRLQGVVSECRALGGDCEAIAGEHNPESLQRMFRGSKVVINISGPFSELGRDVVAAALAERCHYLDSTGEQDFMLEIRRDFGGKFERDKLVLSPSAAFQMTTGVCAAELLLRMPGIDSVKIIYVPAPLQTRASLQSMLRVTRRPALRIVNRELVAAPGGIVRYVVVPGTSELRGAVSSGGAEAVYFMGDPRVRNCETVFASDGIIPSMPYSRLFNRLQGVFGMQRVDKWTDALALRLLKTDPPAETPETTRFIVAIFGEGNEARASILLIGSATYVVTGFLCAYAAKRLIDGEAKKFGFISLAHLFDPMHVLESLEAVGTRMVIQEPTPAASAATSGFFEAKSA